MKRGKTIIQNWSPNREDKDKAKVNAEAEE